MLSIAKLNHIYPNGVCALNDLDLEIPGGMFGLLGPNGAGKSSLMRIVATLQQPTSGNVRFGDIDVLNDVESLRKVLGYLPQEFGVYPRGSAWELLDHIAMLKGISSRRERKKLVERLLKLTNLYDARKYRVANFSGGMHQRFGIAQLLIGNPELVIVDEPTAGLDPEERNRFYNLLADIGQDVVVILSTHIVEDVSVLCPKMAVMTKGEIILQGSPAELIAQVDGYIWQKHIAKPELAVYRERFDVVSHKLSAGKLLVRIYADSMPDNGFEQSPANLEDVYFTAIGREHEPATAFA